MKTFKRNQIKEIISEEIKMHRFNHDDLIFSGAVSLCNVILKQNVNEVLIICGNNYNGDIGIALADALVKKTDVKPILVHFNLSGRRIHSLLDGRVEVLDDVRKISRLLETGIYIVDCMFGYDLNESIYYPFNYLIDKINESDCYVLSCDVPSGINSDNGCIDRSTIKADATVILQLIKPGYYLYPASSCTGKLFIDTIGISHQAIERQESAIFVNNLNEIKKMIPQRVKHSHKMSYGRVLLIAGSEGKIGASLLCGSAIMKTGAGYLTLLSYPEVVQAFNTQLPEALTESLDTCNVRYQMENRFDFRRYSLIVIGPGLGINKTTEYLIRKVLETDIPAVIDADGLNYLKNNLDLLKRDALTVITPHLGEFTRTFVYNQAIIIDDLQRYTASYPNLAIVLKGEHTLISYKGQVTINTTGNNALAKAGSGDVLCGIIGGFLAQRCDVEAVIAAVYIHSLAADYWCINNSPYSLLASDLLRVIDRILKQLTSQ
ncbi:MAG TPA: NAD(P)H-hydrate dehydratase [Erysipelotrichaceae bacterium]|nr:NAD(P)H-hydrate dehydratase [Erysipelotrichaceae bacterium]